MPQKDLPKEVKGLTREQKIRDIQRLEKIREIEQLEAQKAEKPKFKPIDSMGYGLAQTATFGYSDEINARAKALKDKAVEGGSYDSHVKKRLKTERESLKEAKKQNPGFYMFGNLGGALATMKLPWIGIGAAAKFGEGMVKAGLQGGLMASGESENNPLESKEKAKEFVGEVGEGIKYGAGYQGLFSILGKGLNKLRPGELKDFAAERAVKASTGQNVKALREIAGVSSNNPGDITKSKEQIIKAGRDIIDEGIVGPIDSTLDLAPKLSQAVKKYGERIGETADKIDKAAPNAVDGKSIAQSIVDYAESIPLTKRTQSLKDSLVEEAVIFESRGNITFKQAQDLKQQFKYRPGEADALVSNQDASNKVRSIISKQMEATAAKIEKTGSKETKNLLGQYRSDKSKYGSFKGASNAAGDRYLKDLSNRFISPSDYGIGAAAGISSAMRNDEAAKQLLYGALGAMGNKFARNRGSSLASYAAESIAKASEKSPEFVQRFGKDLVDAANRGPAALVATHQKLMEEDKDYRKNFIEDEGDGIRKAMQRRLGE